MRRRGLASAARAVADQARRRRLVAPLGVIGVLALVIGVISLPGSSKGASQGTGSSGVATVQRRDLVATDTEPGTLSYANAQTVYNRMTGTVTWLPAIGQVIKPGQTLYKVDNQPVVLFDGTTPAYRNLSSSDSAGPDIRELNQNLVKLGFDPHHEITVNDTWQSGTTDAVERWQAAVGESQTGTITLGQVVFLPGPQRITGVNTLLGSNGSPATTGAASGSTAASASAGSGSSGSAGASGGGGGTGSAGASGGSGGSGSAGASGGSGSSGSAGASGGSGNTSGRGGSTTSTKTSTASAVPRSEFASLTTSSAAPRTEYVGLTTDSGSTNSGAANTETANAGTTNTGSTTTSTANTGPANTGTARAAQSTAATCPTPKNQQSPSEPGKQPNCKQQRGPATGSRSGGSRTGGSPNGKRQTNRQLQALIALLKAETAELGKSRSSSGGTSGPPSGSTGSGSGGRTAGASTSSATSGGRTAASGATSAPSSSSVGSSVSGGSGGSGGVTASGAGGGSAPQAILQTSSTQLVVTVNLDATKQSEAVVGEPVTVQLPDGSTVAGRIEVVSPVAQTSTSSNSGAGGTSTTSSTIPVTIALATHRRRSGLDQAAVSVNFEQQVVKNVLSVPVTALIATAGGGYAVQEAASPHRLIPVTPGLFAAGYVQISSAEIYPGLEVTDSQG